MRIRSLHLIGHAGITFVTLALSFQAIAVADSPLIYGDDDFDRTASRNNRFVALPTKDRKETVVYEQSKKRREVWRMPGWDEFCGLSNDGDYLVLCSDERNFLPLDYKPDRTMLTFYKRGTLIRRVPLSELIRDFRSLRRTISHYDWGSFDGFSALHRYDVETIEGRLITFDVTTGQAI